MFYSTGPWQGITLLNDIVISYSALRHFSVYPAVEYHSFNVVHLSVTRLDVVAP